MKTFVRSLLALSTLALATTTAHAEAPKCHKDAAKLEWYVCGVKEVEYKRGLKTESRSECAINERIKTPSACDLGDLGALLPADIHPGDVFFYAIGPVDIDPTVGFEEQLQTPKNACRLANNRPDYHQLGKFSDAFDKDNRERGELVKEKLAAQGKKVVGGVAFSGGYRDMGCVGKKAVLGVVDTATFSEALWYTESTFK